MTPSLLTASQARWALNILVVILSAVAIASSAPPSAGGEVMYSGTPGDIRGLIVILGSTGLIGVGVLRIINLILPKVWRVYLDRLEFTLVGMLWICWTSATMSFSAFTLNQGICSLSFSSSSPEFTLPTCPLLTFDLTLLHLLSTASLALLLVILSAALSTNYLSALDQGGNGKAGTGGGSIGDAFVMWELALASPPPSPRLAPTAISREPYTARSYGTSSPTTPLAGPGSSRWHSGSSAYSPITPQGEYQHATLQIPDESQDPHPSIPITLPLPLPQRRRDKFAEGRLRTYFPLALCSFGAAGASMAALSVGEFVYSGIFLFIIAVYSLFFSIACIGVHFSQRNAKVADSERQSPSLRRERALEVGAAGALFLLWPLAAVLYTLFPTTPNRPCANPAASAIPAPGEDTDPEHAEFLCLLTWTVVSSSWMASWVVLTRVMGLVFPLPEVGKLQFGPGPEAGSPDGDREEGRSLLRPPHAAVSAAKLSKKSMPTQTQSAASKVKGQRPQVGWGRIVAGEAFELADEGDADDEESDGGVR